MTRNLLARDQIDQWLAEHPDWSGPGDTLMREVKCPGFPAAIALVVAVADAAQEADHHPDIDIRYDTVRFALSTHSAGGLTALDLRLAERISALVEATA